MSRDRFGLKTVSYVYSTLPCGHHWRTDRELPETCPFCEDYAESFAEDVFTDLMIDLSDPDFHPPTWP